MPLQSRFSKQLSSLQFDRAATNIMRAASACADCCSDSLHSIACSEVSKSVCPRSGTEKGQRVRTTATAGKYDRNQERKGPEHYCYYCYCCKIQNTAAATATAAAAAALLSCAFSQCLQ
eukprot:15158-Heterococcus_DN1.PRE.1